MLPNRSSVPYLLPLMAIGSVVVLTFVLLFSSDETPLDLSVQATTTLANEFTQSAQSESALSVNSNHEWIMVWSSRRQEAGNYGVRARVFDANGQPLSQEAAVHEYAEGPQRSPAVAWTSTGSAWVAWQSQGQDGSGESIVARQLDARLKPMGPEQIVNQLTTGDQTSPSIATNDQGETLFAWTHWREGSQSEIRTRLVNARGWQSEQVISGNDAIRHASPTLTALADGTFVVAWARHPGDSSVAGGIHGQQVDRNGRVIGHQLKLSGGRSGQIEPSINATPRGFDVAWLALEGKSYNVIKRSFDHQARPIEAPVMVASGANGWNSGVAVATLNNGSSVIAFNEETTEGRRLLAHTFDRDGSRLTDTGTVVDHGGFDRSLNVASGATRAAGAANGSFALALNGQGNGDSSGAYLSLWGTPSPTVQTSPTAISTARSASSASFTQAARPPLRDPYFVRQARKTGLRGAGSDVGFLGVSNTGWTPPDPEMAVGPQSILLMTNGEISSFTKSGVRQWQDEIEDGFGFWGGLGATGFVFDPEVLWDPHAERFWAMAVEQGPGSTDFFLLAVSNNSAPTSPADWQKFRLDVTDIGGPNDFIDSPNMSVSTDFVLLTADFFLPNNEYLIVVLEKDSLLSGVVGESASELYQGSGAGAPHSMGTPVVYSDTSTLYLVQSTEFGTNDEVILHAITDPLGDYQRTETTVPVSSYTFPAGPTQKGTGIRPTLFEPRFWSVAERNGSIWAVHHVNNSRSRVRWYEIDLRNWPQSGSPAVAQEGEINLGDGISTFFPSVHVDDTGNAAITFSRSAANEYISIGRALRSAADPPGTFRPAQVVKTSSNSSTSGRWGDYSATQADPDDVGVFWGHHEFNEGSTTDWDTWVSSYSLRDQAMQLNVEPLVAGTDVTLSVTGATPGAVVAFAATGSGTGLTEAPAANVVWSLEEAQLLGTAVADSLGNASRILSIPESTEGFEVTLQAAEDGLTTNWVIDTIQ